MTTDFQSVNSNKGIENKSMRKVRRKIEMLRKKVEER